jgi:hypothetical protein
MTDALIKSNGYYKFRLIPYIPSNDTIRLDPNTDSTRYIEWTQTSNPTLSTDTVNGFAGEVHVGLTEGTPGFGGLTKLTNHPIATWLGGSADVSTWWYAVGARNNWGEPNHAPFAYTTSYDDVTKTELWVYSTNV